jgi:hypothetical protein
VCGEHKVGEDGLVGYARVASHQPVLVPAGTARVIEASASHSHHESYAVLVEPVLEEDKALPKGLQLASTLSMVVNGRTYVQVANFSTEDTYLYKKAILGKLI